jgi:hypothetical protein
LTTISLNLLYCVKIRREIRLPRSRLHIRIFGILEDHVKDVEGVAAVVGVGVGEADLRRSMVDFEKQI